MRQEIPDRMLRGCFDHEHIVPSPSVHDHCFSQIRQCSDMYSSSEQPFMAVAPPSLCPALLSLYVQYLKTFIYLASRYYTHE